MPLELAILMRAWVIATDTVDILPKNIALMLSLQYKLGCCRSSRYLGNTTWAVYRYFCLFLFFTLELTTTDCSGQPWNSKMVVWIRKGRELPKIMWYCSMCMPNPETGSCWHWVLSFGNERIKYDLKFRWEKAINKLTFISLWQPGYRTLLTMSAAPLLAFNSTKLTISQISVST